MKNKHYIYYHRDYNTNDIIYIGVGYNKRAWTFKWGRNKYYLNYIQKYGIPNVEIIKEKLYEDEAYDIEIKLIKQYGRKGIDENGILLNRSEGGKTSAKGNKQYITQEWKDKIGNANRGKIKHNNKSKESISNKNSKSVLQYDLEDNFIKEWKSVIEIENKLGFDKNQLYRYLQNKLNLLPYGFIWKYKENTDNRNNRPGKSVIQYDLNNNFIKEWKRISDAIRETNIKGIQNASSGKAKTAGGFIWKYKN